MAVKRRKASRAVHKLPPREQVDPLSLDLDTVNPRFAAYGGERHGEKDVIRYLLETADLQELIASIAANGYVDLEPLLVVRRKGKQARTVVEGNRRVAAIRLLRQPDLAAELGVALPPISAANATTLKAVTVQEVASRDDARQYIGFKHINGPHKWDAFAKGKFAADWYRAERAEGVTIRDIAQRLGDRHDTILRLVSGIFVLEQASEERLFEIADRAPGRPFFFSHLYTALTRSQYRTFLGLEAEWRRSEPAPSPVPRTHLGELRQVLTWIYGSETDQLEPLVTSQNPHIKQLGEVLEHRVAPRRLEATRNLQAAYSEVAARGRRFQESLVRAVSHAEDAQQSVDAYDGDPTLIEFGTRLAKIGQGLVRAMRAATAELDEDDAS